MNTLDNLLLILFVAVFLFYCYRKKKFPFSKLRKGTEPKEPEATPNGTFPPNAYPFAQMYPHGIQFPLYTYSPAPPSPAYCKLIGVDKDVIDSDMDYEHVINTELSKLNVTGCTVCSVSALSYSYGNVDGAEKARILFCITYTK